MFKSKEKSTLTVDENDILNFADKIRQNRQEDENFIAHLSSFFDDTTSQINAPITIGATPNSLIITGADRNLKLIINPDTILKCIGSPNEVYHGHELTREIMEQLPNEIRNPALILNGSHTGSLVAVTELKDKENREIIAAIELESRQARIFVNRVTSAYGKDSFAAHINREVNEKHNLLAVNKEKANDMFQSLGLQLPPEETFISFNNSIAYSMANVKYKEDSMDIAIRLINEYCEKEFDSVADFSNLQHIDLAYTNDEDTELPIKVYADLDTFRLVKEYDGVIVNEQLFNDLSDMNEVLGNLEFDKLVALSDQEKQKVEDKIIGEIHYIENGISVRCFTNEQQFKDSINQLFYYGIPFDKVVDKSNKGIWDKALKNHFGYDDEPLDLTDSPEYSRK